MDIDDESNANSPQAGKNADEAALELMKQLITLASGVLALSAAFIDKLPKTSKPFLVLLALSWISLITSLVFGLQTISAIVKSRIDSDDEWADGKGRKYGRVSRHSFLIGIGLFVAFAFSSLAFPIAKDNETTITIKTDDPRVVESLKQLAPKISDSPIVSPSPTTKQSQ